jgi:hypothetical protein
MHQGAAQGVACLLLKYKALSSNPSPVKQIKASAQEMSSNSLTNAG